MLAITDSSPGKRLTNPIRLLKFAKADAHASAKGAGGLQLLHRMSSLVTAIMIILIMIIKCN
jgi:hypothetical protein